MSKSCNFGTLEESLIRDRIVVGIKENSVRKRLLQETKLTLKDTINICKSSETTIKQLNATNSDDVAFVSKSETSNPPDKKCRGKCTIYLKIWHRMLIYHTA